VNTITTSSGIKITINPRFCKGCEICIAFCPKKVLALDDNFKVVVENPDACTGCLICELLCPDFAISIEK